MPRGIPQLRKEHEEQGYAKNKLPSVPPHLRGSRGRTKGFSIRCSLPDTGEVEDVTTAEHLTM